MSASAEEKKAMQVVRNAYQEAAADWLAMEQIEDSVKVAELAAALEAFDAALRERDKLKAVLNKLARIVGAP